MIHGIGKHAAVIRSFYQSPGWVIAVGDNHIRKKEVEAHIAKGHVFGTAIHPKAIVYPTAEIGEGSMILAGAIIGPHAVIGKHCIVNHGATVDHDCIIECFAHIAPGAHLCGEVRVGEGALVGVGVGIAPRARIPAWHLVKARRLEIVALSSY